MDIKKLIKRLLLSQKDPDLIKGLSESEVAFLVAHLVAKMESHTKFTEEIKRIIEEGKMKTEQEYKETIRQFQERIQGIDVDSINLSKSEVERMIGESRSLSDRLTKAEKAMLERAETLRDGKDADEEKITESIKDVLRAELPNKIREDFLATASTLVGVVKEGLEALEGDDRLSIEAINGLEERLRAAETKSTGGGVTNARIQQAFKYILKTEAPSGDINGVNTDYTVTQPIFAVLSFSINGESIAQLPNYTLSGKTISFSEALPAVYSGSDFEVKYL